MKNTTYDYLFDYISKTAEKINFDLYSYLSLTDLNTLFSYKKNIKDIGYTEIQTQLFLQKQHNSFLTNESIYLAKKFNTISVKVIFFKGVFLSNDLYEHPATRKTTDIDILVSSSDIEKVDRLLECEGYIYEKDSNVYLKGNTKFELFDEAHLKYSKMFLKNLSVIEVHKYPVYLVERTVSNVDRVISRAVECKIKDTEVYLLEIHDRLLQLFLHFAHHLTWDCILPVISSGRPKAFPVYKSLLDAALLINKYYGAINFDTLFERIEEINLTGEIWIAVKIFYDIFPNFLPDSFYKRFEKLENKNYDYYILSKVAELPSFFILTGDVLSVNKEFDRFNNQNIIECREKGQENICRIPLYKKYKDNSKQRDDCRIRLSWDKSFLYVSVERDIREIPVNEYLDKYIDKPFAEFLLKSFIGSEGKFLIRFYCVNLTQNYLLNSSDGNIQGSMGEIAIGGNKYRMEFKILFADLNIVPAKNLFLPFDITLMDIDMDTGTVSSFLSLFTINDSDYTDFRQIGKIKLN